MKPEIYAQALFLGECSLLFALRVWSVRFAWNLVAGSLGLPRLGWKGAWGLSALFGTFWATPKLPEQYKRLRKSAYELFGIHIGGL